MTHNNPSATRLRSVCDARYHLGETILHCVRVGRHTRHESGIYAWTSDGVGLRIGRTR